MKNRSLPEIITAQHECTRNIQKIWTILCRNTRNTINTVGRTKSESLLHNLEWLHVTGWLFFLCSAKYSQNVYTYMQLSTCSFWLKIKRKPKLHLMWALRPQLCGTQSLLSLFCFHIQTHLQPWIGWVANSNHQEIFAAVKSDKQRAHTQTSLNKKFFFFLLMSENFKLPDLSNYIVNIKQRWFWIKRKYLMILFLPSRNNSFISIYWRVTAQHWCCWSLPKQAREKSTSWLKSKSTVCSLKPFCFETEGVGWWNRWRMCEPQKHVLVQCKTEKQKEKNIKDRRSMKNKRWSHIEGWQLDHK